MITLPPIRLLVIDDNPRVGRDLAKLFDSAGYEIKSVLGVGQSLITQAREDARTFRPHVSIVDLRLFGEDSGTMPTGLDVITEFLNPAHCVLYSGHLTHESVQIAQRLGVRWVAKDGLPRYLSENIQAIIRDAYRGRPGVALRWTPPWTPNRIVETIFGGDAQVPASAIDEVLNLMFPDICTVKLEPVLPLVADTALPRSLRSMTFRAYPDDEQSVVVILAPRDRIRSDAQNYRRFVHHHLEGHFYPSLEYTAEFWDLGGSRYSFMGSEPTTMPTFQEFYHRLSDVESILEPVRHFFLTQWSSHYNNKRPCTDLSLIDSYDATPLFKRQIATCPALQLFDFEADRFVTDPAAWVLEHADLSDVPGSCLAVTHGNLNADNLFVDGKHIWPIGFEMTGWGPRLRDFAALERDILTRLIPWSALDDLSKLGKLTWNLAQAGYPKTYLSLPRDIEGDVELSKAARVIAGIRQLAHQATHCQDFREYLWTLLLDALSAASSAERDSVVQQQNLMIAAVLCTHLKYWRQDWQMRELTRMIQEGTAPRTKRYDVFLSYSSRDKDAVEHIARRLLNDAKLRPWLDQWDAVPGRQFISQLQRALSESCACAVFRGQQDLGPWQEQETGIALLLDTSGQEYPVIPVLLPGYSSGGQGLRPSFLDLRTWVDFRNGLDDSEAFRRLVAGIRNRRPGPP
jgi:hypothetical protein